MIGPVFRISKYLIVKTQPDWEKSVLSTWEFQRNREPREISRDRTWFNGWPSRWAHTLRYRLRASRGLWQWQWKTGCGWQIWRPLLQQYQNVNRKDAPRGCSHCNTKCSSCRSSQDLFSVWSTRPNWKTYVKHAQFRTRNSRSVKKHTNKSLSRTSSPLQLAC